MNWGDDGLKRFFRRAFVQLRPGGLFIIEPQSFDTYKKRAKLMVLYFLIIHHPNFIYPFLSLDLHGIILFSEILINFYVFSLKWWSIISLLFFFQTNSKIIWLMKLDSKNMNIWAFQMQRHQVMNNFLSFGSKMIIKSIDIQLVKSVFS